MIKNLDPFAKILELPNEKQVYDEVIKDMDRKPDNMVVRIKDPIKINVKGVTDTAKLVMKKVVIVLEPKKFNQKRNKLTKQNVKMEDVMLHLIQMECKNLFDIVQFN